MQPCDPGNAENQGKSKSDTGDDEWNPEMAHGFHGHCTSPDGFFRAVARHSACRTEPWHRLVGVLGVSGAPGCGNSSARMVVAPGGSGSWAAPTRPPVCPGRSRRNCREDARAAPHLGGGASGPAVGKCLAFRETGTPQCGRTPPAPTASGGLSSGTPGSGSSGPACTCLVLAGMPRMFRNRARTRARITPGVPPGILWVLHQRKGVQTP